jgi:hypothetical protein
MGSRESHNGEAIQMLADLLKVRPLCFFYVFAFGKLFKELILVLA